jgi:hypothetical protein
VTKFVGKFRKNKNYNDDHNYEVNRHRDEHSEIKKLLTNSYDDWKEELEEVLLPNNTSLDL